MVNFKDQSPLSNSVNSIRENWPWFLGVGIFLTLLGLFAIGSSVYTTVITVMFLGIVLAAGGIAELIHAFYAQKWSGFFLTLLGGLLYLVAGFILLFKPLQGAAALTLLIGLLFVVSGLFKIFGSIFSRVDHWGWILLSGLISLVLGILVLQEWPLSSLWLIGLFVGIDLLTYGLLSIFFAFKVKNHHPIIR